MFGFGLQLPLPHTVTKSMRHSLSAIQLSPHNVLLVAFGGQRSYFSDKLFDTFLIELSEYCNTAVIVTDTAQYCTRITAPLPCSPEKRWSVGGV